MNEMNAGRGGSVVQHEARLRGVGGQSNRSAIPANRRDKRGDERHGDDRTPQRRGERSHATDYSAWTLAPCGRALSAAGRRSGVVLPQIAPVRWIGRIGFPSRVWVFVDGVEG